jgi:MFS family permease
MIAANLSLALRALRHRNVRLFFASQLISLTGSYMQAVAQAWLVYRLTNSPALLGVVAFWGQISVFLLAPVSGTVADRISRHTILIATQTSAMLLSLLLAALTIAGNVQTWHVFIIAALLGVGNAFEFPARQAFVADLVPKDELMSAVTLNSSVINTARMIGPAIAGYLIAAIGEGWCFFANGVSYIAVIVGLILMNIKPAKHPRVHSLRADIAETFRFIRKNGTVAALLFLLGLVSLMGMRYDVLMPVFAKEVSHGGPSAYGLLMAASGVGAILGSLGLMVLGKARWLGDWIGLSTAAFGASLVLLSFSRSFGVSVAWMLLVGFSMVTQLDSSNTLVQEIVPNKLRGRVMSVWTMMLTGLAPFGSLLAGVLGQRFGAARTLAAGGMACIMGAVVFGFYLPILKRRRVKLV